MDSAPDAAPCAAGSPIRRPRDQSPLAAPPGLSQRAASFIASRRQGIHRVPFSRSPRPGGRAAGDGLRAPSQCPRTTNAHGVLPRRADNTSRTLLHTRRAHATKARARVVSPPHDAKEHPPPCACRRRAARRPARRLVGPGRLERPTSRLSGARSNRLSYGPGPADARVAARATRVAARDGGASGGVGGRDARTARPARIVVPPPRPPAPSVSIVDVCRRGVSRRAPRRAVGGPRRPQKGGDPAAGSPTATLLRLHPSRRPDRGRPPPHRWGWPAGFG